MERVEAGKVPNYYQLCEIAGQVGADYKGKKITPEVIAEIKVEINNLVQKYRAERNWQTSAYIGGRAAIFIEVDVSDKGNGDLKITPVWRYLYGRS